MNKHILIVDDHGIVLKGLVAIVRETLGNDIRIDTACSGSDAVMILKSQRYDICILDIGLPDMDGVKLLKSMKSLYPAMAVIVHTVHDQIWYMKEFLKYGADAIIFKNTDIGEIAEALRNVIQGNSYLCHGAKALKHVAGDHEVLTRREHQILTLLAQGKTSNEIAGILGITVATVEFHRGHLLEKFSARNVADLIVKAISTGYLSLPLD